MQAVRRVAVVLIVLLLSAVPIGAYATPAPPPAPEVISNGDFETAAVDASSQPQGWYPDSWGLNASTFTYLSEGHSGTHSIRTDVVNFSDGDAKWVFNSVNVPSGGSFTYSDWYRSTQTTYIWARYQLADGSSRYLYLRAAAPSSIWTTTAISADIPGDVVGVSISHVLAANGQLDLDDVSMKVSAPCMLPLTSAIANGGFESACVTLPDPDGWRAFADGSASAVFSNSSAPWQGAGANTATVVSGIGEIGWKTPVNSPKRSQRYRLSFEQSGTTSIYAYLRYVKADGSTSFASLMAAPETFGTWSKYSDSFLTPPDFVSMQLVIATAEIGTITIDDVVLEPIASQVPPTFSAPMVSVTFDDGLASQFQDAVPTLNHLNLAASFYVNASTIGTAGYLTATQLKTLSKSGNEIGSHLYHHSRIGLLDPLTLSSELLGNASAIQRWLGTTASIVGFASPFGSFTDASVASVMSVHQYHRTTDGAFNTKANLDPRQIHARLVIASTTSSDVKTWVAQAKAEKSWLVLVYHGIATAKSTALDAHGEAGFTVTPKQFTNEMNYIKNSGVRVATVQAALTTLA